MGLMVDSNVFIKLERNGASMDFSNWVTSQTEEIFISAITVSELLIGVHRADNEMRKLRRAQFVETVLSEAGVLEFTASVARLHAKLTADLFASGQSIGAHDLIIAATARFHDFAILTDNVAEFSRVPGLRVVPFALN